MSAHYGVIGVGPIGSVLAAHLGKAGRRVSVLCSSEKRARALRDGPLRVTGALSAEHRIPGVYVGLAELLATRPEAVLIATKSCDSPALLDDIRKLGPDPGMVFVSCQNGIDVEEQVVERFGPERALRMVLNLGCHLAADNEVQVAFSLRHFLSDVATVRPQVARKLADDLTAAGFAVELVRDCRTEVFRKAILNSSMGAVAALTGATMREVLEDASLLKILKVMIRESIDVAEAMGLSLGDGFTEEALAYMAKGGDHRPSIAVDIQAGRLSENESHCGRIVRYAAKHGIAVPVNQAMYSLLRKLEERRKGA